MKRFDVRLAVGSSEGPRSDVWHFWSRSDHVYAVHGSRGDVHKFSFHPPNVCRLAFTREHGGPSGLPNRAMHEWRRAEAPPSGAGGAVRVLRVGFATAMLSTALDKPTKEVTWVRAAPRGSTVIDLILTREDEETVRTLAAKVAQNLITYKLLPNGEAFCLVSWFSEGEDEKAFVVPASHHARNDLIVSPEDPDATGRPVRLTTYQLSNEGYMCAWEFGAYYQPPSGLKPTIRFIRRDVLDRS
jgi:hypothetical protein